MVDSNYLIPYVVDVLTIEKERNLIKNRMGLATASSAPIYLSIYLSIFLLSTARKETHLPSVLTPVSLL
jgi:hypothetical protein